MAAKTTLKFADNIDIVVPDSLDLITTYVLQEQGDWFEDEIKFVRWFLQPGQKAIDIGANYGLFTLTMAQAVGPAGKVWAFEPASSTAAFLAESIASNRWGQIKLDQRALSDRPGTARLSLNNNSELNEIIRSTEAVGSFETVCLTTLDGAMDEYGWQDPDFIKIDAEGEEAAILRGGRNFFRRNSPLVQYEVKAGAQVHLELVSAFKEMGYDSYRLVPGLAILAPFDPHGLVDGYLLNLFCCKPDRAHSLAQKGVLVLNEELRVETGHDLLRRLNAFPAYGWEHALTRHHYGRLLKEQWHTTVERGQSETVNTALALYAVSEDDCLATSDRYMAMQLSTKMLVDVCNQHPTQSRLLTLARVAREFGARTLAVMALETLLKNIEATQHVDVFEPFLAASKHFESVDPERSIADWFVGSSLEALERNASFSSFYTGSSAIQRLANIQRSGFGSPEMAKRLELVKKRFAL